jgi:hypothetical protein
MDIQYKIGDKISYSVPVYYDDEPTIVKKYHQKRGYIFAIEISQQGLFRGKKGYSVRYKVHPDFEGMHGGWDYVWQKDVKKTGQHPNADKYQSEC